MAKKDPPPPLGSTAELARRLLELQRALARGAPPEESTRLLAEAGSRLRAGSKAAAIAALLEMLNRRVDASTGLVFQVGPGGNLAAAPTFRVWLLDQFGQIDHAAAARYSSEVYARRESADEWAIALRNDWRAAAPLGQIAPVRARVLELLAESSWVNQPSNGFLEAFDLAVATMAWEALPRLEQLMQPGADGKLRRAAWVALDRLTLEVPADFLPALAQHSEWLQSQPLVRAGLFARADLGAEREREAVEAYLRRADLAQGEASRYFELAPNINATISHNLATTIRAPSLHDAARLDRAALAALQRWQTRPEFARWREQMAAAERRIQESVAAAIRGGFSSP